LSRRTLRGTALAEAPVALALRPAPVSAGAVRMANDAALAEAEAIVAAAHAERDAVLDAARRQGYEEGRAEAALEARELTVALGALHAALEGAVAAAADEAAEAAVPLALEVAAKLVRAEVAARPERVVDVLRGAIRRATSRERMVAHVNPADLAACRDATAAILADTGGIGRFEVMDDPRIARGSCVLETGGGDVDATFESQLARILAAVAAPPDEDLVEPPA
jgi:flagellar assembly protein FliH